MQFHKFMIGIMLFSLVIVTMLAATTNIVDNFNDMGHSLSIDETQSEGFDKIDAINARVQDIEQSMTGSDLGGEDSETTVLTGAWGAILIAINAMPIVGQIISATADIFHIPTIFVTTLYAMVIVTVLFTAAYMIFKSKGE